MRCAGCNECEATEYKLLCNKCCVPFGGASVLVIPILERIAERITSLETKLAKHEELIDTLYGKNLVVEGWYLNGESIPFNNFADKILFKE